MMNGENGGGGGGVAKPTPPPTLPKSYTPNAAAAYRLASMERLAQRQRIFEQGGPAPPPPAGSDDQHSSPAPATSAVGQPPPVTAPKPVLGTKASIVVVGRPNFSRNHRCPPQYFEFSRIKINFLPYELSIRLC